ncbi:hypothetical protein FZO89_17940 [Luteimonas viscosa]|uniref:Uncharacterized protein n=1 Tax=Luteimonas viscosa TaxID=1132694 RepID=A0A5D4XKB8_9GAMM|nr:hypothetical protein [Luteimonas viscosa]TYT23120.1 hypothetical protein FZO89_17940 [Luteimonas viscosa]
MTTAASRAAILTLLAATMAATRLHHFGAVPDASWAVFFVGGFYLSRWTRWAFPLLMALAVTIDWIVISGQGLDFWSHYCMSPGYWALVPAHLAMWTGGWWLQRATGGRLQWRTAGLLLASVVAAVVVCHLFAQGGFYWTASAVAEPTLAGWWKNYTDWLPAYLRASAMYVGIAAALHVALVRLLPTGAVVPQDAARR